jgi:hypothetical protein
VLQAVCGSWFKCWVWAKFVQANNGTRCASSSTSQVSDTVWGLRQSLTGGITETIVKQAHEGERQRTQARCPRCTRMLQVQDHVWRTVEMMVGLVELERPYFYCRSCRAGLYPLDDALGLVAGCQQLNM